MDNSPVVAGKRTIYKLVFTDDESIVREGITTCIDWKAAGFELAGCFENGRQTLDFVRENPIHLVLSDINMPVMDGLSMSQALHDEFPGTKVVLLTGYDEFEYARQALHHQVSRYLLKPITSDELFSTLIKIHEELDQVYRREEQQEKLRTRLLESQPLLKERFLNRLLRGKVRGEVLHDQAQTNGWDASAMYYSIAAAAPLDPWDEIELLQLSEYTESLLEPGDELFRNYDDEIILLLQGACTEMLEARTQMVCEQMYNYSQEIRSGRICIGIGPGCGSIEEIPRVYSEARNALRYVASIGLTQILPVKEFRNREHLSMEMYYNQIRSLIELVKTGKKRETDAQLEEIFSSFESCYMEPDEVEMYLDQLRLQLQQSIREITMFSETSGDSSGSAETHTPDFCRHGDFANYRDYIRSILADYQSFIHDQRHRSLEHRISKAREIIEQRFRDKEFSLSDICNELYLSTSQFSVIFKEGVHMTFLEYLTKRRIDEAKQLLKSTDLKGYEIAANVGFADPRYFSIVFKKYCGMTAMQFRRSLEQ